MQELHESRRLLEAWKKGDQDAARQLVDRYLERLVNLARKRISPRLAGRVDPEDIAQSVFRTFFVRAKEGKFRIEEQDDLCKLLMRITVHKVLRKVEFHQAAKRDPHMEVEQGNRTQERMMELLDREPSPEVEAQFVDQLECLLSKMKPLDRQILQLRIEGFSNEEISKKLGIYDRKIRRIIERIRGLAEQSGLSP